MAALMRAALALAVVAGLAACETTRGFIQDSENLGSAVADELDD
ncbi:hypothetical protein SAMN05444004_103124 [Jannaschia faecimaris]|uniref:Entericidin EcnA/B family protein n=1 Tax=Jannaschia faecimaris TaxID=1244108 RepID=A0A1H3MNW7_9RHOB|nr:entericidin [Jannaschia faecimaris]SDY78173.1 hypothetical protein SAMN05444004_103124 [Jannaschia faecimaris]